MITTSENKAFYGKRSLNLAGELYEMDHPWVMGILNINANSFYDGGAYTEISKAVEQCSKMLEEGADIIDIGAASTKPGSKLISPEKEWKIVEPFLKELKKQFPKAWFSIDTYNASTAEKSVLAGAHLINDISAGTIDDNMAKAVGELKVPYVMMHMQGTPATMQENPSYENIFKEVAYFFSKQIDHFNAQGAINLILDPGFGFGKTPEHNYQLLNRMGQLKRVFNLPLLAGLSRKSMVSKVIDSQARNALNGTTAANVLALQNGADILRVHDVKEAVEACKITTFTQKFA